jgi:hypothetical protein
MEMFGKVFFLFTISSFAGSAVIVLCSALSVLP